MPISTPPTPAASTTPTPAAAIPDGEAATADMPVAPAVRVLRQFRVVMNAVKTHFRQVEKEAGIGGAQLWALGIVQATPAIGMNDLALALDIHQSTASNLVKSLVQQNMLAITRSESDRRTVALQILPAGLEVLKKAPAPFTGVLPDALASLDTKTLLRLEKDLGKLVAALAADEHAAHTPLADHLSG